ncbi:hypothetical protein GLOIN_2v1784405 [Rhizophagus clarus]|uniref:F-box domain-containing protein n=1 Tax=Rhizophagus clarus TaxID=94130 RepID=A0A8H3KRD9_9GLOM|nr:hypothetical protein GLOIN_2v1784405 [Rhizophagus clarus]
MPPTLPIDCLFKIMKCLEEDRVTLHLFLLVNCLFCRICVEILWGNLLNYKDIKYSKILDALITCLPNESKDLLFDLRIIISSPKVPLFNYISFSKVLPIN